jgi:hypothetical protein
MIDVKDHDLDLSLTVGRGALVNDDRKSRFGALVTVSEAAKAAIAMLR